MSNLFEIIHARSKSQPGLRLQMKIISDITVFFYFLSFPSPKWSSSTYTCPQFARIEPIKSRPARSFARSVTVPQTLWLSSMRHQPTCSHHQVQLFSFTGLPAPAKSPFFIILSFKACKVIVV